MVKLSLVVGILALASSANAACDFQKCATDYSTAAQAAAGDMPKVCAATKTYVDCFGALTDCGAMQSAVDMAKQAATSAMSQIESMCGGSSGGGSSGGGASSSTCDFQKCGTDYATASQAAAGDVTKVCAATKAWVDCFGGLTDCGAAQSAVDMAKKAADNAMSQMGSVCGGSGGGDSGSSGCDQAKAQTACADPAAKFSELMTSGPPSGEDFTFKAFTEYCANGLTVIGAYTKCAAANGCAAEGAQAAEQIKASLAATCKAGPTPESWMAAAAKDDAFVKCMGDAMPAGGGAGPTCDQAKKNVRVWKRLPCWNRPQRGL